MSQKLSQKEDQMEISPLTASAPFIHILAYHGQMNQKGTDQ